MKIVWECKIWGNRNYLKVPKSAPFFPALLIYREASLGKLGDVTLSDH